MNASTLAALFFAGVAWWTLLEYLLHRFAFHGLAASVGRRHLEHHALPRERRLAIASWTSSVGGAAIHAAFFLGLFGPARGGALLAGLVAGYLGYEWVHWSTHYRKARTRLGRALRRHHMLHHHAAPGTRFGVTSPLWDWVFGTLRPAPPRGAPAAVRGGRHHLSG